MPSEKLESYDGEFGNLFVGDEVQLEDDSPDGAYMQGETGKLVNIVKYTGTMNDRVAAYVLMEGADDPTEFPPSMLAAL